MGEFVEEVYIPFAEHGWKKSSAGTAMYEIRMHVLPELGDRTLHAIRREDLQAILDRKASGASESIVKHVRWFMNAIFKLAMTDGLIRVNPAASLIIPKNCKPSRERRILAPERVPIYMSVLARREQLAARLSLIEGMRPGEFLGRRFSDVVGCSMQIDSRVYRGVFDTPKNGEAREIALSRSSADLIAELRLLARNPEGFIFASETGETPISRDNLWRRYIAPRLMTVGLQWANFQVLRRTNASVGQKGGVDPKVASDQRGHGLGTSMKVYTKSDLQQKQKAVKKLEAAMLPKQKLKRSA
ncbi:MAG: hypothetical protein ABL995_08650 [Bryobacteraceae bacterium]